ncbi:beta-lactamase-like protein [Collybia nuda]|uniref:ribonuclease Z n=1 Tax=Collybia nuda TaxID=64659 RepID=A0A9P5YCK9_9AGAR|nr:beta-lactamase-like protein [Collybia nuda]
MNWSASVLTTASSDTEPTIVITFDSAKYIFNAGENTNRSFLQSRRNWKRTRGLFFTHVGTERASGLPGLLMSFADATIPRLDIVGPPGISHYLASMRSYTFRDSMPIYPTEASWTPATSPSPDALYKDGNITVYSIPVPPCPDDNAPPSTKDAVPSPDVHLKRKREDSPDLPVKRPTLAPINPDSAEPNSSSNEPQGFVGEAAQDWRKLMIDTMFPGSRPKSKGKDTGKHSKSTKSNNKGKGRGAHIEQSQVSPDSRTAQPAPPVNPTPHSEPGTSEKPQSDTANVDIYKRARVPPGFHKQLPPFVPHSSSVPSSSTLPTILAYIIVGPRVRGKFNVEKANSLGVPAGRQRGILANGKSVTFKVKVGDELIERTVQPEECVGESETPGSILILDIPTTAYIPSLTSAFEDSPFYSKFRSNKPEYLKEYAVRSVFHLCGDGVLEDEKYKAFMNGFAPGVHHIISSREHNTDPVTFTSAAFNQLRLNQLDPETFPIPKFSLAPRKKIEVVPNLPPNTCLMRSNLLISMRPPAPPVTETCEGDLFHEAISSESPIALPALTRERFSASRAGVEDHIASGKVHVPKGADVGIIPLGTGSAIPTKFRNVSSTLIQIPNWGNILLDAGEGTWGQLVRQFGLDDNPTSPNVWDTLRNMKCIFVSHIHGDHHMGLAKILAKRRMLDPPPSEPLYLVTIRAVHLYLREFSDLQDLGLDDPSGNGVITVMAESLHFRQLGVYQTSGMWQIGGEEPWTDFEQSQRYSEGLCRALGLKSFRTVDVYHRTRCYGAVIKHTDGWSIVFSADTQPTDNLVWAGRDATLLIHEATMADDQVEMAKRKAHSTFGQAVEIGKRMGAENILLTHFSARYPKMPPSGVAKPNQIGETSQKRLKEPIVALAFDHANLTIGNLWKLNYYLPAVEQSFMDTKEEDDEEEVDPITMSMDVDVS